MREVILDELNRRHADYCNIAEKTTAEHIVQQCLGATAALSDLGAWLESHPVMESTVSNKSDIGKHSCHYAELIEKAHVLVKRKGEMSVELWNDKAQCLIAPITHALEAATARAEKYREALEFIAHDTELLRSYHYAQVSRLHTRAKAALEAT